MVFSQHLAELDPELSQAMQCELSRQQQKIEMIASENFVSQAVMGAVGSVLTNKYAEGYPGKRYYGGCECVDLVENLARNRAKEIFGAEHVNVQAHSGAQANMAAYFALINHGDTVLGMNLAHGGHLTHGSPVNFSGRDYHFVAYGVDPETETIDYDLLEKTARECQPKLIVAGASAYPRILDFHRFQAIAQSVGAKLMVDMAHIAGLVAAGVHPTPVPYADIVTTTTHKTLRGPRGGMILCRAEYAEAVDKAVFPGLQGGPLMHVIAGKAAALKEAQAPDFVDYQKQVLANAQTLSRELIRHGFRIVSGGTDNHLLLIDVRSKNLTGKDAEHILDEIGITVNKNAIPFDTQSPYVTSGVRVGTPALTTRGMGEEAVVQIAAAMDNALSYGQDPAKLDAARKIVRELTEAYPLYV